MAKTYRQYPFEGNRTTYPVDFQLGYLDRSHIYVYIGDVLGNPLNQIQYTWINANQISLHSPILPDEQLIIRRITPRNNLINNYEDNARLKEKNLNDSYKQALMILQELEDGLVPIDILKDLDMKGFKIINLGNPDNANDAVTKIYVDSALAAITTGTGNLVTTEVQELLVSDIPSNGNVTLDFDYLPNSFNVRVEVNGIPLRVDRDYLEQPGQLHFLEEWLEKAKPTDEILIWNRQVQLTERFNTKDIIHDDTESQLGVGSAYEAIVELSKIQGSEKVYDSFFSMVNATDIGKYEKVSTVGYFVGQHGIGNASYIKTTNTGNIGETDGGSYFVDITGNRWELSHNGTVYLEQFGAQDATPLGLVPRRASGSSRVTKVTTNLSKLIFDHTWPVQRSNIEIDFNGADIDWTGVYNIYFDDYGIGEEGENFGVGDRTVGVIGWRSVPDDSDIKTVTSPITDGTNKLTLNNTTGLQVGDYVRLGIVYPRRTTSQLARIQSVVGDDISINYSFAWDVNSCTLQKIDVYKNVSVKGIGKFNDLAIFEDTTPSTAWAACPVAFRGCVNVELDGGECSNTNLPAVNVYECQNIKINGYEAHNPRNISAGRGYTIQINRSSYFEVNKCVGWNTRHAFDISGASLGSINKTYGVRDNPDGSFTFTSHGEYEHDVTFNQCYDVGARISIALARSGIAFGAANKRIKLQDCTFSGLMFVENVDDLAMTDVTSTGTDTTRHRLGVRGNVVLERVKFASNARILVSRHNDITGAVPDNFGTITFRDCHLPNDIRHSFHEGSYKFDNCTGLVKLDFASTDGNNPTPIWADSYLFTNMDVALNGSAIRANSMVKFDDVVLSTDGTAQAIFCYNGSVEFENVKASSVTARELRIRAPVTKVKGGEWNNIGVVPELATAIRYELSGLRAVASSNIWRAVNTTNLAGIADNCTFTGAGGLQLGGAGSTGTTWRLSNVTSAYNMLTDVGSIVSSIRYRGVTSPTLNDWATWP